MRFASLGSGSRGNALLVEAGRTRILVDCGFGPKETVRRLGRLAVLPEEVTGIVVTHEHADHLGGVFKFAARHDVPVWLTHGTLAAAVEKGPVSSCTAIDSGQSFWVGELEIRAFPVSHDAREPVQYVFSDGCHRLGVLTDTGVATSAVAAELKDCDGLVLECNHDRGMLAGSAYPAFLKRRIAGQLGHLSNEAAAALLVEVASSRLQHVVAAHLSRENNTPALASVALAEALGCSADWIGVACQDEGFGWRELS